MSFNTLEEARAEILRLQQVETELTNERDTLSRNNESLTADLERVRTLNQDYFNRLTAQYSPQKQDSALGEPEISSCEEFANKINI